MAYDMAYDIIRTARFKRDYKLMKRRNCEVALLMEAIRILAADRKLPGRYRDHELSGSWAGHRECHIQPDWLLVYRIDEDEHALVLSRTGTHSDLFQK
jgi:mRNA interferase YafQ